jgi:hypothetical protein
MLLVRGWFCSDLLLNIWLAPALWCVLQLRRTLTLPLWTIRLPEKAVVIGPGLIRPGEAKSSAVFPYLCGDMSLALLAVGVFERCLGTVPSSRSWVPTVSIERR